MPAEIAYPADLHASLREEITVALLRAEFKPVHLSILSLYLQGYSEQQISPIVFYQRIGNMVASSSSGKSIKDTIHEITGMTLNSIELQAVWACREGIIQGPRFTPLQKFGAFTHKEIEAFSLLLSGEIDNNTIARSLDVSIFSPRNIYSGGIIKVRKLSRLPIAHRIGAGMILVAYGFIPESVIGSALPVDHISVF